MNAKTKSKQLLDLVTDSLEGTVYELVSATYSKHGGDWLLQIFIDHADGVTLEHCGNVTRLLNEVLEENDPVEAEYTIEVSSPGVDRPLVKAADYTRFLNNRIYLKTHQPVDGVKTMTGILEALVEDQVKVRGEDDNHLYSFPLDTIAKATLKPILNFC